MKFCIATTHGGLEDQVSPVFGRCPTFTFVDVEGNDIKNTEIIQNEFATAMGGAGIQAAQLVVNKGADVVIAGNYGPNAYPILSQAGVNVVSIHGISVKDAVMRYLNGELKPITQPTAPMFGGRGMGMGRGMGRSGGKGMGRGMGRSGGKGMGRGMGRMMYGTPASISPYTSSAQTKEQEIQALENQANQLEEQLNEIKKRIDELKK